MTPQQRTRVLRRLDDEPEEKVGDFIIIEDPFEKVTSLEKTSAIQTLLNELRADRAAKEAAIAKRLDLAIAKEEALHRLIAAQKQFVAELLATGVENGELVGPDVAAKHFDLPESTLRYYAEKKIIPCYKMGRHRKYNLAEVTDAIKRARDAKLMPRLTDAQRKRILR